jgi:hypothetical protein
VARALRLDDATRRVKEVVMKLRRPWVVGALSLFPFYWVVWYYEVNREMRDYGRDRGDAALAKTRPWLSVLAVTLGGLVLVPPLVSEWRTVRRLDASERIAGAQVGPTPFTLLLLIVAWAFSWAGLIVSNSGVALALLLLGVAALIAASVLMQRRLTRLWTAVGQPPVAQVV